MVNAKFCDIHKDQATSLIRAKQKGISFYTITLAHTLREKGKDGKVLTWNREAKLDACNADVQERILDFAKGLGVELEWRTYRLVKNADGKYSRIDREEEIPTEE